MKKVLMLGASGNIASHVVDILETSVDIHLTLFLRNAKRLKNKGISATRVVEGDVLNYNQLKEAI